MDRYTKTYLNLILEQDQTTTERRFSWLQIDDKLKQELIKWIIDYKQSGGYYGDGQMQFFLTQDIFLVIYDDYSVMDKENGFKINIDQKKYFPGEGLEWVILHYFDEEFNINEVEHAVDKILNWLSTN